MQLKGHYNNKIRFNALIKETQLNKNNKIVEIHTMHKSKIQYFSVDNFRRNNQKMFTQSTNGASASQMWETCLISDLSSCN